MYMNAKSEHQESAAIVQEYEVAVLYHPDLEVDSSKGEDNVKKIFKSADATIKKTDNWGKRKLLYPIKKQEYGLYVFYTINVLPENVQKIDATLNITDEVIRHLIVRRDPKMIAKVEAAIADKAKKAADRDSSDSQDQDDAEE